MTTATFRRQNAEPNSLTIEWTGADGQVAHSETFYAAPSIPAQTLLDVIAAQSKPNATPSETFQAVLDFADAVFLEESRERYAAAMKSADWPIDLEMLQWTIERLAEMYGGRPTPPSDSSSDGA